MSTADIDAILRGNGSRRRWLLLGIALAVAIAAVVAAFLLTRPDDVDVAVEPEQVEATAGQLTTEVELTGSAVSERSADLSFEVAGVVDSVAVAKGDEVRTGDALAALVDRDAQRGVETAEVQLRQSQLRLEALLSDPEESAIASANQAIVSARAQVMSAEQALEALSEPPSAADLASAEQAVAAALGQISSAEQALEALSEPPSAADLASAEQAVAAALGQISSAEQALEALSEPPSAADLASAEQAVAAALGQISSAEQALDTLLEGPSEAQLSEARSSVTRAQVTLSDATRLSEELMEALTEASEDFCNRYNGLIASDETIRKTCAASLPLADAQVGELEESYEDRSATYESFGTALIDANVAFIAAASAEDSAISNLATAEEGLADLLQSATVDELYQAEQAVEAAKASHASAVARLADLQETASEDEVYQAEQAVGGGKSQPCRGSGAA